MDIRTEELIAIGASVTANCQPCLSYHVSKAKENGATEAEISEAIAVGKMVRKGAQAKMDKFVLTVYKDAQTGDNTLGEGCGTD